MSELNNIQNKDLFGADTCGQIEPLVMRQPKQDLFGNIVIKSIGYNETEMIENILHLHSLNNKIDLDPTYSIGNFYKNGLRKPEYKFDKYPQCKGVLEADASCLPLGDNEIETIMFDPPFVFGIHGQAENNIMAKRFTIFNDFNELEKMYKSSLQEFYRILKPKGIVIYKCQDYTDSKTTMTHCLVHNWATEIGFYAKDLFILLVKQRIANGNLQQRHARKFHSYFWVLQKVQVQNRLSA